MKKAIMMLGVLAVFAGCYNDKYDKLYPAPPVNTCDTTTISYATDIVPIINTYCANNSACHTPGGASGLNYTVYSTLMQQATSGILIDCITGVSGYPAMPLNGAPLSQCDINKMTRWVNEGAPNN